MYKYVNGNCNSLLRINGARIYEEQPDHNWTMTNKASTPIINSVAELEQKLKHGMLLSRC